MKRRTFIERAAMAGLGYILMPAQTGEIRAASLPANKPEPALWPDDRLTAAWIGHSTVLMNFCGVKILTDPVFFERIGLYFWGYTWGPARYTRPALRAGEIPKPDIVLLSHAHMDHMDYESLKFLSEKYPDQIDVVTSWNSHDVIEDLPWKSLKELDWGQKYTINDVEFEALEVKHFGWRYPWEKDRSRGYMKGARSYNAYYMHRSGKSVLFGGDTAYTDKLDAVKGRPVDVAIMPVGAYNPWKFNHCNPEEALKMAHSINARNFIPIHCNTFQQGREPVEEPLQWVKNSIANYGINLGLDEIGKTFVL
ncbi:MAG: MBL fold metallo-hydrolase [Syntrophothermus sp.]